MLDSTSTETVGVDELRHVLIHANGTDPTALTTALRVAKQAGLELGAAARFHVVVQGDLVRLLAAGTEFAENVTATTTEFISVAACKNSLKRAGMNECDLLPGVSTVPSAGAYLAARQWEGWAYLRY